MRAIETLDREAAATGLAPVTEAPARPAARTTARTTARPFRIPAGGEAGTPMELVAGDGVVGSDARADVRLLVARRATGEVAHAAASPTCAGALRAGDVLVVNTSAVIPAARRGDGTGRPRAAAAPVDRAARRLLGGRAPAPSRHRHRPATRAIRPARWCSPEAAGPRCSPDTPPGRHAPAVAGPSRPAGRHPPLPRRPRPADPLRAHRGCLAARARTSRCSPRSPARPRCRARPGRSRMRWSPTSCARGVVVSPVTLHTGVSSQEAGEAPYAERLRGASATAAVVNAARADGRRVVAVGTTVVRALETTADEQGRSHPGAGLDRDGRHARAGRTGGRRAAHRLARARVVAPGDAGDDRRPLPARGARTTRR